MLHAPFVIMIIPVFYYRGSVSHDLLRRGPFFSSMLHAPFVIIINDSVLDCDFVDLQLMMPRSLYDVL